MIGTASLLALGSVLVWRLPEGAAWWWHVQAGAPRMTASALSLAPPLRWFDPYYAVAEVGEGAYAIGEPRYGQCNFSYLIVGTQRALLFDTGPGVRNIAPVVAALTPLPVLALPSHLHFDHVGNLERFSDVALPDLPALRRQVRGGRFRFGFYQYLGFTEGFRRPSLPVTQWIEPDSQIDLGGRSLRLLSVPGHTPESVVLFEAGANRLFAGDFIYPSAIYAYLPGADLGVYAASARRVEGLLDEGSTVYGAHGCEALPFVTVPALNRADVRALRRALEVAAASAGPHGRGWYPREFAVNEHMTLLAKYPWMSR